MRIFLIIFIRTLKDCAASAVMCYNQNKEHAETEGKTGMKTWRYAAGAAFLLAVLAAAMLLSAGYDAGEEALAVMEGCARQDGAAVFAPESEPIAGMIFYPGGLVDQAAYAPLMQALSGRGILCLLVNMPMDLAVLNVHAADGLAQRYPDIRRWLIGGHSLGGAMAAEYASKHAQAFDGLVLLGAYSAADLTASGLRVLSIYGTEDGVLNREKYENSRANYPEAFEERVIEGGNHAQFGDYGAQKGDGIAKISGKEQTRRTADAIAAFAAASRQ